MTSSVTSTMIALQLGIILFLSVAASVPVVYGAGIGGIFSSQQQQQRDNTNGSDVPSIEDVLPTFEQIQRQLLVESGVTDNEDEMKSIIDGSDKSSLSATSSQHHRRTQGGSGPELSFMIMLDEFDYSNDPEEVTDITIGTKFAFTGRIVTKAEELGLASGTCTVTSDTQSDLSYCTIYHKIDTDNFGGYGTVMVSGSVDEVGGRLLVTGTGGTLAHNQDGYAMVQVDPAGNPIIYVLLKLH
eukprot:CAMPEP_0113497038 /NCGR_PEP_ID=MMETSP0014_2-20120614/30427_1 /TAXON_ID=2857 /ORGANISM="Nitzschia sp." /LENGTH=241 /DNA_ID=CAMNT_0000390971 /DNA_START=16 /DNA_END=741 /DNA_ORIENTATION=- /assembly_acc=CAM_ASM_000159